MDENTLVSVIVPVYKVERYLDECVAGIVGQTHRRLEILLVDDGSPDGCPAMCDAWAAKDDRIRVIHKTNGGLSDARNAGLAQATGECIYFVDSDDAVAPQLIEHCLAAMREHDADLVMFQFDTISENGAPLISDYKHNDFDQVMVMTPVEGIKAQLKADIDGYFWSFLAAAPIYKDHAFSFPVGRKIEDMARICNVIGESRRIVRIPEVLYHYRLRGGSITSAWSPQLMRDWMKAADDRETYILERYPELKGFMRLQQLTFFANLDYETIRQTVTASLNIDPEDADEMRRRIDRLRRDIADDHDEVPESTRSLLELLKDSVDDAVDDFREMRDDWKRIGRGWKEYMHERTEKTGRDQSGHEKGGRDRTGFAGGFGRIGRAVQEDANGRPAIRNVAKDDDARV
ncbi:glycosyltransferase family 2 protein [Bifidobacterium amazonense]|uniref:Glycosyltransferase family 2 protein n=1 Tax=Bifidobacterium amazonense TaxID=2809027 RepID=A0ABS9VTT4_9BIFI|nr:glycosyltransferase family 2 protein [Bifidobacterium amazonense]